jgi:hypothetical protein
MGGRGHAGMKTSRIMVFRFVRRKMEFINAIGQPVAEEPIDDGARFFGNRDVSMADGKMSSAEPRETVPISLLDDSDEEMSWRGQHEFGSEGQVIRNEHGKGQGMIMTFIRSSLNHGTKRIP